MHLDLVMRKPASEAHHAFKATPLSQSVEDVPSPGRCCSDQCCTPGDPLCRLSINKPGCMLQGPNHFELYSSCYLLNLQPVNCACQGSHYVAVAKEATVDLIEQSLAGV